MIILKLFGIASFACLAFSELPIDSYLFLDKSKDFISLTFSEGLIDTIFEETKCLSNMDFNLFDLEMMRNILYYGKSSAGKETDSKCPVSNSQTLILDYRTDPLLEPQAIIQNRKIFYGQTRYFRRVCLPLDCVDIAKMVLDKGNYDNRVLFDYLESTGVRRVKIVDHNKDVLAKGWKMKLLKVVIGTLILVLVVKLFYTLLSKISLKVISNEQVSSLNSDVELSDLDASSSYEDTQAEVVIQITKERKDESKIKNFIVSLDHYFSIYNSIYYLFKSESKYYNQNNLYFLSFLRFVSLFFITYFSIFTNFMRIPEINRESEGGPSGLSLVFFKISSFFLSFFISIEGIYLAYKLMGYITKNSKTHFEFTFAQYLKFNFKILSRVISFLVILLIFYICIREVSYFLENSNLLLYFHKTQFDNKICYQRPDLIFIPFYLQYLQPVIPSSIEINVSNYSAMVACFIPIHVAINLLYSVLLFNSLCYICLKIRKTFFDIILFLLMTFGNTIIMYYYSVYDNSINDKVVTLKILQGERESFVKTHLFFSMFFFGSIVGITIFYHKDIVSNPNLYTDINFASEELKNDAIRQPKSYVPHIYLFKLMRILSNCKNWVWYTLTILCGLTMLGVSLSYSIYYHTFNSLIIDSSSLTKFLFVYEKKLFNLSLLILVLISYLFDSAIISKKSWESKLFVIFERISLNYFLIIDSTTAMCVSMLSIQQTINCINLLFFTLSIMIVSSLLAFIITVNLEVPMKIMIKGQEESENDMNNSLTY